MKKLFYVMALSTLLLSACGKEEVKNEEETKPANVGERAETKENKEISIEQYEEKFVSAFNKLNIEPNVNLGKMEKLENGRYSLIVNQEIMIFADVDKKSNVTKASIAGMSSAVDKYPDLLKTSAKAFITSLDDSINETQQNAIFDKLGITFDKDMLDRTKVYKFNDIRFTYNASIENGTFVLQAEKK